MLIPVERDLRLYPGYQFNPLFQFYEDDARTQPFDLAGYSAQLTIGSGLLVLSTSGGLTVNGALGQVQALATSAQTAAVPVGDYEWVLQWAPSGGQPDLPAFGTVAVRLPVRSK